MKTRNVTIDVAIFVSLALALGGCGGSASPSTVTASSLPETTTSVMLTTSTSESTTTTVPPTTTTVTDLGTLDNPLPVGDPGLSGFTYSSSLTDWDGYIGAIVEAEPGRFNDEPGRCLIVLGTLTPTSIEDGTVTNIFSTPDLSMIVDGRLLDSEVNECNTDAVEAAGYSWILDAEVTVGTNFPFYSEFFIAGESPGEPEALVLGNASGGNALYYEPTISSSIPPP